MPESLYAAAAVVSSWSALGDGGFFQRGAEQVRGGNLI